MSSPPPLTAFINFPSPYTQSLILSALTSVLSSLSLTFTPQSDDTLPPPSLQWADYDLLSLPHILFSPTTLLISSYIYRKTLIRKHNLHLAIQEYLAKQRTRGKETCLEEGVPKGWVLDLMAADELDELLMDELYDLREGMEGNEGLVEGERKWYILKPGMSDKGQGIRLFSTEAELRQIFDEFEPESSDDKEDEEQDEESSNGEEDARSLDPEAEEKLQKLILCDFPDDEPYVAPADSNPSDDEDDEDEEDEEEGTGVRTSQLRHFVIQEYIPHPMLFSPFPSSPEASPQGHKFHLRAYVLLTGTYELYLSRTVLALFAGERYTTPRSEGGDVGLDGHLTNTCLQSEMNEFGEPTPPEHLVHTLSSLLSLPALSYSASMDSYAPAGVVTQRWVDGVFQGVGEVVAEAVRAGVECGGVGVQLLPNAFEIFGVDLLLSFPSPPDPTSTELEIPRITLLEFNASPDFTQSGTQLRGELRSMFEGVVRIVVGPFFGLKVNPPEGEEGEGEGEGEEKRVMQAGEERYGWRMIARHATRGGW